jgi:hypothetical protein
MFTGERLLQGDTELARIEFDRQLVAGDREYAIARLRKHGWHYIVVDRSSEHSVCEYLPFRMRRGGRLIASDTTIFLRGKLLRPRLWSFTTESGQRVRAHVITAKRLFDPREPEVVLEADDSVSPISNAAIMLAFGCWLIVRWASWRGQTPAPDVAGNP